MFACLHVISIMLLATTVESSSSTATILHYRRTLHQPFFPTDSVPPPLPPPVITQPPPSIPPPPPHTPSKYHYHKPKTKKPKSKSKQTGPKYPFSSQSPPPSPPNGLFFPTFSSPPSPPSPPLAQSSSSAKSLPTFPANITSIGDLPQSSPSKPVSHKLAAIAITVSLVSAALILIIAASLFYYHRRRHHKYIHPKPTRSDSLGLYDTATTSDKPLPPQPPQPPTHRPRNPSGNSAEFLYLGTLAEPPRIADHDNSSSNVAGSSSVLGYQKLGSPELRPLPPLPRHDYRRNSRVGFLEDYDEDNDVEFFSPKASSDGRLSPNVNYQSTSQTLQNSGNRRSSNSKSPSDSASPSSLSSSKSYPTGSVVDFPPPPWPPEVNSSSHLPSPGSSTWDTHSSPARVIIFSRQQQYEPEKIQPPPPPPPMPPVDYWEASTLPTPAPSQDPVNGPPPMIESPKTKPILVENLEEIQKPKLKALHWDKVKASSNTTMVWDQMKSNTSFQLNEEMMETLFMMNSSNSTAKDFSNLQMNNENRVLDPKKSQNIAILLRAVNVTIDEVCEGLLEGNIDNLGTDLLESLLKMAPTKEEESKLMEVNDASTFKLGPAEKFLKALLDVPFAFKRVDALLYIANFDSEVEYLKRSFETLEAACDELRNSKMFLKLLEAVLKTGNRMNVGTNRGDAHAFKLDTLLKLADIKGTDGRTTLLHFVVQEIIRTEGHSRLSVPNQNPTSEIEIDQQSELRDDVEFRKIGLQVVSSLSGELSNVKKAAVMDSNMLYSEVGKLATGITKIGEVFRLNEEIGPTGSSKKFRDSMNGFLKKAKNSIIKIQAQESAALSMVKDITEYFHGNSVKEEAHPFRIFVVVGDFLSVLDQVCRDVGKMNERTIVNSARSSQSLPQVFPQFLVKGRHQYSSAIDDMSSSP